MRRNLFSLLIITLILMILTVCLGSFLFDSYETRQPREVSIDNALSIDSTIQTDSDVSSEQNEEDALHEELIKDYYYSATGYVGRDPFRDYSFTLPKAWEVNVHKSDSDGVNDPSRECYKDGENFNTTACKLHSLNLLIPEEFDYNGVDVTFAVIVGDLFDFFDKGCNFSCESRQKDISFSKNCRAIDGINTLPRETLAENECGTYINPQGTKVVVTLYNLLGDPHLTYIIEPKRDDVGYLVLSDNYFNDAFFIHHDQATGDVSPLTTEELTRLRQGLHDLVNSIK